MSAAPSAFERHADLALVGLVIGVLVVLFAPIPAGLLDFLILCNVSFGLLVLLLTFYMGRPAEFSTFPSLLLIATLFRLSLNVAATRLILADANAGKVIGAVGSFVVGGNYVIGFIVFLILVVVQYVVVTSGAQRVSEVAARFTLDSMPGQQMSIDADLNMGLIDQAEAQRRRKNLEREAGFYGAMDGASKFVKGDAIAGIVILLINSIGGLVIGVMQRGMPWSQALKTFTLLTIGDGIVTQVPALIISVATGIIVTRSASDAHLSRAAVRQLTGHPKTLFLVAGAMALLTVLPGIPALPVLGISALAFAGGWAARRAASRTRPTFEAGDADGAAGAPGSAGTSHAAGVPAADGYAALRIHPIEVSLGAGLTGLLGGQGTPVLERVATFRRQFALECGVVVPAVHFREAAQVEAMAYEIQFFGVPVARAELHANRTLAIHPGGDTTRVTGLVTREPTYGLPAVWVEDDQREAARKNGFTLVDAETVFVTHLTETLRLHVAQLLTRSETEQLLNRIKEEQPGLVEDLIPTLLSLGDVQKVLQLLLREKVSVRHIEAILEALGDAARVSKDPGHLAEAARLRLGSAICQGLAGEGATLQVLTLDPLVEQTLMQSQRRDDVAQAHDPAWSERVVTGLIAAAERMVKQQLTPVLLCAPELRRALRSMCERSLPQLRVISYAEVPSSLHLKSFGTVNV